MPLDRAIEEGIRERLGAAVFRRWMGFEVGALGDGESEIRMRLEPHHLNPGRIAHGGVIATLVDAAIGIALRTRLGTERNHVTVNLSVQYLAPAPEGTTITARGKVIHSGARTGYGEAELVRSDGTLVAKGSATFLVVPGPVPDGPIGDA